MIIIGKMYYSEFRDDIYLPFSGVGRMLYTSPWGCTGREKLPLNLMGVFVFVPFKNGT